MLMMGRKEGRKEEEGKQGGKEREGERRQNKNPKYRSDSLGEK